MAIGNLLNGAKDTFLGTNVAKTRKAFNDALSNSGVTEDAFLQAYDKYKKAVRKSKSDAIPEKLFSGIKKFNKDKDFTSVLDAYKSLSAERAKTIAARAGTVAGVGGGVALGAKIISDGNKKRRMNSYGGHNYNQNYQPAAYSDMSDDDFVVAAQKCLSQFEKTAAIGDIPRQAVDFIKDIYSRDNLSGRRWRDKNNALRYIGFLPERGEDFIRENPSIMFSKKIPNSFVNRVQNETDAFSDSVRKMKNTADDIRGASISHANNVAESKRVKSQIDGIMAGRTTDESILFNDFIDKALNNKLKEKSLIGADKTIIPALRNKNMNVLKQELGEDVASKLLKEMDDRNQIHNLNREAEKYKKNFTEIKRIADAKAENLAPQINELRRQRNVDMSKTLLGYAVPTAALGGTGYGIYKGVKKNKDKEKTAGAIGNTLIAGSIVSDAKNKVPKAIDAAKNNRTDLILGNKVPKRTYIGCDSLNKIAAERNKVAVKENDGTNQNKKKSSVLPKVLAASALAGMVGVGIAERDPFAGLRMARDAAKDLGKRFVKKGPRSIGIKSEAVNDVYDVAYNLGEKAVNNISKKTKVKNKTYKFTALKPEKIYAAEFAPKSTKQDGIMQDSFKKMLGGVSGGMGLLIPYVAGQYIMKNKRDKKDFDEKYNQYAVNSKIVPALEGTLGGQEAKDLVNNTMSSLGLPKVT